MFIGHLGVGLGAKRFVPRVSLGWLFFAVEFLDLIWPIFVLLGWEHFRIVPGITAAQPFDFYDYPISHSLLAVLGWSLAVGVAYYALRREARGAWILGVAVMSHWVLDFVSHRPDMPILPRGPYVGLGLWNSLPASMLVEFTIFGVGLLLYLRQSKPLEGTGRYALVVLVGFLLLAQVGSYFAPPPPSARAVALGALAGWLLVPWASWIDRHRSARPPTPWLKRARGGE